MIKLVCYGSKTLHLKEAYYSYVGEKKFTKVQIITADEIDGHKVDEFNVELHIIRGIYDDKHPLTFTKNGATLNAEYTLDSSYTSYARELGFYLKFTKTTETEDEIVGLTNAVYLCTRENKKIEDFKDEINHDSLVNSPSGGLGSSSGVGSGKDGRDGKDGKNGVTYTPSISADGILSWTNDGELENPAPIKILGSKGENGTSVVIDNISEGTADGGVNVVTFSDGKTLNIKNGLKGSKGDKGDPYTLTEADVQFITNKVLENFIDVSEVGL